jgi:hypothetical protein
MIANPTAAPTTRCRAVKTIRPMARTRAIFGEGGQTVHRPLSGNDVPKRKAGRDPTVPREDTASTS